MVLPLLLSPTVTILAMFLPQQHQTIPQSILVVVVSVGRVVALSIVIILEI